MSACVMTMTDGSLFRSFRIDHDGSAVTDRGLRIQDFADFFIHLCEMGWKMISQMEVVQQDVAYEYEPTHDEYQCDRKEEFKCQWYDMMSDLTDNYDRG